MFIQQQNNQYNRQVFSDSLELATERHIRCVVSLIVLIKWPLPTFLILECFRNCYVFFPLPVQPNLDKVAKIQSVLSNHLSSLWCPAQGAPAPVIAWRKNGIVVQNSTSVKYQLTITEENNYSCEVKRQDGCDKKEISLVMESEFWL